MNIGPRVVSFACTIGLSLLVASSPWSTASSRSAPPATSDSVSFRNDVFPIIKQHCLPCHAEDNYNPSELALDSYAALMEGGRHGKAVIPGNVTESKLILKLHADPPFGDRMPLDMRKKKGKKPAVAPLDEEEIQTIATWITQGARDN